MGVHAPFLCFCPIACWSFRSARANRVLTEFMPMPNCSAIGGGFGAAVVDVSQTEQAQVGCNPTLHLSDALTFVMDGLHRLPGRRVMLAITDGNDKGSKYSWNDVRAHATATGVAVFGMGYIHSVFGQYRTTSYGDAFRSVCELSGGMVFPSNGRDVAETLQRFAKTLRERYIVEFPPPFNSTAGGHRLRVTIDKLDALILPAGIVVPMADPVVLADPATVPADPSRAPMAGTRQVLIKPQ